MERSTGKSFVFSRFLFMAVYGVKRGKERFYVLGLTGFFAIFEQITFFNEIPRW